MASLEAQLNKILNKVARESESILRTTVADTVVSIGKTHVDKDVYKAYSPKVYKRTGKLQNDWEIRNKRNGVLIRPSRMDGKKYVPWVVESGTGYDAMGDYPFKRPRPFLQNTYNELLQRDIVRVQLQSELNAKGIKSILL